MANYRTNIDNTLVEMIDPKIKNIEEKFSKGQGLSSEDVNTLLLKSQFNHINHLDQKLNEVTKDVANLKVQFESLRSDVKTQLAEFKTELAEFKTEIGEFKTEIKTDFANLKTDFANLKTDFANLNVSLHKAINKNMQWSIGIITFIVTALKVIDMIWK